jgi:uncharacterized protein (DUF1684 family)
VATFDIPLAADGVIHCARVARVSFTIASEPATLALYWFGGYGGGLWLPFSDATSGESTYGGGRYLYDTIKGADLGTDADRIVLDFNFAYNPSCAYDDRWVCPLSPRRKRAAIRGHGRRASAGRLSHVNGGMAKLAGASPRRWRACIST